MMTTIAIKEETKKELLRKAAELQERWGKKVGYDETIRYLLRKTRQKKKNPALLMKACLSGLDGEILVNELMEERRKDDQDFG